jgi:hypothetical protein
MGANASKSIAMDCGLFMPELTTFPEARLPGRIRTIAFGIGLIGVEAGAACVTRTRDPIITNDVLYRLS